MLGAALGAGGAYALARALTGKEDAACLAGAAYALAPYPFYVNLYGQAAVPEALGLGLLPWLLLAGWMALSRPGRAWPAALAALTAALLLSHNISAAFGLALAGAWLLAQVMVGGRLLAPGGVRSGRGGASSRLAGRGLGGSSWGWAWASG